MFSTANHHCHHALWGFRRASPSVAIVAFAALVSLSLASCGRGQEGIAVSREQLFTLSYGKGEDQVDLFQTEASQTPLKTRIAMREGIFYLANGNASKVVRLSSFGDVLSMIYNPERNPEPLLLKSTPGASPSSPAGASPQVPGSASASGSIGTGTPGASGSVTGADAAYGRRAVAYPFRAVGEIAVDSRQTIYVEDRLPPERRVYDKDLDAVLDHVVLRFDKDGNSLDYLGQEGVGGTPFPFIQDVYTTNGDDCIVVSLTQSLWLVDWFDAKGFVKHSMKIKRDNLPQPQGEKSLIASLDRIAPDSDGKSLVVKIDYYRNSVDPNNKSDSTVEFASSWAYRMDPSTGSISDRWQIPAIESTVKGGSDNGDQHIVRIPELIGMADRRLFFLTADDQDRSQVSVYDTTLRSTSRYNLDIAPDELYYSAMYLSPDGILCALLGTKYEARVVWWRFDKLLGGAKGSAK